MKTTYSWHETDIIHGRLQDKLDVELGLGLATLVADLIRVKGGGEYSVAVAAPSHIRETHDYFTMEVEARTIDGKKLDIPYPLWDKLPKWVKWWTVSAMGTVVGHEFKPQYDMVDGSWVSPGYGKAIASVEIPVGIDWRTLCFERPIPVISPGGTLRGDGVIGNAAGFEPADGSSTLSPPSWGVRAASWWRQLMP